MTGVNDTRMKCPFRRFLVAVIRSTSAMPWVSGAVGVIRKIGSRDRERLDQAKLSSHEVGAVNFGTLHKFGSALEADVDLRVLPTLPGFECIRTVPETKKAHTS